MGTQVCFLFAAPMSHRLSQPHYTRIMQYVISRPLKGCRSKNNIKKAVWFFILETKDPADRPAHEH